MTRRQDRGRDARTTTSAITRRDFLRASAAAAAAPALAPLLGASAPADAGKADKPNIVLVLADDLGYECLTCNGGQSYRTPHLDVLATGGTLFDRCYSTPLCTPSRVQLMSGQYPFRNGWPVGIWTKGDPAQRVVSPALPSVARVLKSAGYATAVAGKWQLCDFARHPRHPAQLGFDRHCLWTWQYQGAKKGRYRDPAVWQDGKLRGDTKGQYGPDVYNQFLLDFISANRKRPFFAYYPMALVHSPFSPTPDSRRPGGRGNVQDNFADMVAYMDKLVGRLVAHLKSLGLAKNTLVLFTGDNGTPRGIRGKWNGRTIPGGKGRMTEAGTHVPLLAWGPGRVPAGKVRDDLVDFADFMPTLADVAGATLPDGVTFDGRSFGPQLAGRAGKPREWAYVQLGDRRFVRGKGWTLHGGGKLVRHGGGHYTARPVPDDNRDAQAIVARKQLSAVLASLKK